MLENEGRPPLACTILLDASSYDPLCRRSLDRLGTISRRVGEGASLLAGGKAFRAWSLVNGQGRRNRGPSQGPLHDGARTTRNSRAEPRPGSDRGRIRRLARHLIADTSPLIYLAAIGHLELVREFAAEVLVTPSVLAEAIKQPEAPGAEEIRNANWLQVQAPSSPLPRAFSFLGDGEAETLALGLEVPDCVLLLDEKPGRRVAKTLELPHTGTLGLLKRATLLRLIPQLRPLLDKLVAGGFRIEEELMLRALVEVGEFDDF